MHKTRINTIIVCGACSLTRPTLPYDNQWPIRTFPEHNLSIVAIRRGAGGSVLVRSLDLKEQLSNIFELLEQAGVELGDDWVSVWTQSPRHELAECPLRHVVVLVDVRDDQSFGRKYYFGVIREVELTRRSKQGFESVTTL